MGLCFYSFLIFYHNVAALLLLKRQRRGIMVVNEYMYVKLRSSDTIPFVFNRPNKLQSAHKKNFSFSREEWTA
jgi:hypothetical protein